MRMWLVRHGQSTWNAAGRVQGQSGEGLSMLGRRQAVAAAAWLAETIGTATVVSSDLARAHETAVPIAAALGADLAIDPALRERAFGAWEGRTAGELDAEADGLWQQWAAGVDVVAQAGGESNDVIVARVVPALRGHADAARAAGADDIVVVSHGGVIWHGLHALLGLPALTLGGVGNASVTTLLFTGGRIWLDAYNSMAHLASSERTTFTPREFGAEHDADDGRAGATEDGKAPTA